MTTELFETGGALAWLVGGIIAGLVLDMIMRGTVTRMGRKPGLRTLSQVLASLRWLPTSLGLLFGAGMAARQLGLDEALLAGVNTGLRIATIVVVSAFTARAGGRLVRMVTSREDVPLPSGSIFVNLVRGTVWVLGVVWVLATAGISVAPLLTALGIGGLAVGLALQPTLENLFSGIQLIASGQIKPGDFIRLDSGDEGTVLDVTWRNTAVQRVSNDVIVVPNSVLARSSVTNFSAGDSEFVLTIPVSFASAGDPDLIERVAREVAAEVIAACPEAVPDQEPGASFAELTPPAAVLNVFICCRSYRERVPVRHEFIRRLATRFAEEGIEAPPLPFRAAPR